MTRNASIARRLRSLATAAGLFCFCIGCSSSRHDARPDNLPTRTRTPPGRHPPRVQPAPSPRKPIEHEHVSLDECKTRAIQHARSRGLLYRDYETCAWRAEDNTVCVTIVRIPREQAAQRIVVLDKHGQILRILEGATRPR